MKKDIDYSRVNIKDLASKICEALHQSGINAILVGGACVSIYSNNQYQSYDLDFVTYEGLKHVAKALAELGFKRKGRYFVHDQCMFFVDFVNPPVAVGQEPIHQFEKLHTKFGSLTLLTPTDCVKDRLAAYFHWNDLQSLEQAILVARDQAVDLDEIARWAEQEGCKTKFWTFLAKLQS